MCMGSKPKIPETKMPETPKAPPAPEKVAEAPEMSEAVVDRERSGKDAKAKKKGTSALRIDLAVNQPSGNGLTVPQG